MQHLEGRPKNQSRRKRWRLTPRFWAVVAVVAAIWISVSYAIGFYELWRLRAEIRAVQREIEATEARNQQLREELAYLQSDEYVEKVAREELGLVMPGETPVILAPPQGSASRTGTDRSSESEAGVTGP